MTHEVEEQGACERCLLLLHARTWTSGLMSQRLTVQLAHAINIGLPMFLVRHELLYLTDTSSHASHLEPSPAHMLLNSRPKVLC